MHGARAKREFIPSVGIDSSVYPHVSPLQTTNVATFRCRILQELLSRPLRNRSLVHQFLHCHYAGASLRGGGEILGLKKRYDLPEI